jgi:hypothetical protein
MSDKRAPDVPRVVPPQQYRVAKNAPSLFFPVFFQPQHGDISSFTLPRGLSRTVRIGLPGDERERIEGTKTGHREAPHRAV